MFHSIAKNSQIKFVTVFFTLCFLGSYAQTTLVNYTFNAGNAYAALSGNPASGILSTINSDAAFTTAAGAATGNQAFTANAIAGNALVFDQISGASVLNLDVSLWGQKLNGFKDYKLYFQARRTTSGASLVKLYYSTDSASFTLLQNIDLTTQPASQYNQFLIDLSSFTALNNSSHLIFRLEIGGASALSGTCRIDNLQIQASCTQGAEPTVAVDSLEASNVGCQQLILHWKKGNGQKTLLIARAGSAVTATPTDLTAYNAASAFGSGSNLGSGQFVIYNDTNNQVTVSSLNQNTTYYFKAFVFNDNSVCSNSTNYLITGTEPTVNATTGQCFDILSILAHACGAPESYNEMFRFKTGNEPINIFDLQVGGSTSNNAINWGKWPNVNLPFNGFYQSNYTHIKVDSINNTITSCGILIEPPAGVIPPNKQVIVFTDTMVSPTANSFAALSDTLYAVFQKYTSSPAQGCFVNTNNGGFSATPNGTTAIRNLAMRSISNNNLSDQVSYDAKLLVNTNYGTINNQIYGGPSAVNRGATIIYDNPGNATYVNFGCRAPFIPFGVNPVITTVKSNNVLCTGDSILLKANPTGPYTSLQWTGGNGGTFITPAPGIDSIWYVATPTDVGNVSFNVHIVGYCGNIIDSTVHIIVVRPSTAFITPTGPTTFCQGDSVTLQGNSGSGYSYAWLPNNQHSKNITVTDSGQYTLQVTNVCGASTATIHVQVNPNPSISIAALGATTFCEGGNVSIKSTLSSGSNYSWSIGGNSSTVIIDSTKNIYAVAYDSINHCPNDTSNYISVTELKYPIIEAGTNTTTCSGNSVLIGDTAQPGINYTWTSNPAGFNSNNAQATVSPTNTTTYYYEANNGICKSFDTVTVTVTGIVPASIVISSDKGNIICENETVVFSSTIQGGGLTPQYQWYVNGTALINQTANTFTANTLTNGDQVLCVLTSSLSCASGSPATSNTIVFTVNKAPNISITPNGNTTFCSGQNVVLTAGGLSSNDTYTWSTGQSGTSITVNTNQTVTLTANNTCGQDVKSVIITVNDLPNTQIITSGATTFCIGNSVDLSYTQQSGATYAWSTGQIGNPINVTAAGWIKLSGVNLCGTKEDSVLIVVNPNVTAAIVASATVICNADSVKLTSNSAVNNLWSTGQTAQSIWIKTGGTYTLTVSSAQCGNASENISIQSETVTASFTTSSDTGTVPAEITLTSNGTGAFTYSWDFGNITQATGSPAIAEYKSPGVYTVVLTATGVLGCKDTASKKITITDPPVDFEFPNIFSPNSDGKNDLFKPIQTVGILESTLEIYNRWGMLLFQTNNTSLTWDGRNQSGEELPEGVYYYMAKAKTRSGTKPEIELNGYITLIK